MLSVKEGGNVWEGKIFAPGMKMFRRVGVVK